MAHITATRRPASHLTEGYPVPQCEERARLPLATYMYQTRCSLFWFTNSFVHQPVYSVSQVYESGVCSTFCTTSGTTSGTPGTHQFYFQLLAPWATHPCVMHSCALFMHPCAMHFRYSKYTPAPDSPPFRCTLCHTPMCNAPMCSLPAPMCYAPPELLMHTPSVSI